MPAIATSQTRRGHDCCPYSLNFLERRGDELDFLVTVIRGGFSRTVLEHAEDFEYDDYYDYEYQ